MNPKEKITPDKSENERVISEVDEPKAKKPSALMQESDYIKSKKMDTTTIRAKDKRKLESDVFKFKTGRDIIFLCLGLIFIFYASEIAQSVLEIAIDPPIKLALIEPVKFVLTATIGYIFAEYNHKKSDNQKPLELN